MHRFTYYYDHNVDEKTVSGTITSWCGNYCGISYGIEVEMDENEFYERYSLDLKNNAFSEYSFSFKKSDIPESLKKVVNGLELNDEYVNNGKNCIFYAERMIEKWNENEPE